MDLFPWQLLVHFMESVIFSYLESIYERNQRINGWSEVTYWSPRKLQDRNATFDRQAFIKWVKIKRKLYFANYGCFFNPFFQNSLWSCFIWTFYDAKIVKEFNRKICWEYDRNLKNYTKLKEHLWFLKVQLLVLMFLFCGDASKFQCYKAYFLKKIVHNL